MTGKKTFKLSSFLLASVVNWGYKLEHALNLHVELFRETPELLDSTGNY